MGAEVLCGVDEAGRGALAGPVVAAAVILGSAQIEGLKDSKQLPAAAREKMAAAVAEECVDFAYGFASVEEIDEVNILNATMIAMQRAVAKIVIVPDRVLIDGNRTPELPYSNEAVVSGDSLVAEISAASVLAKVERDRVMRDLARALPQYGFEVHKGYPTAKHLEALAQHGASPHHRRGFGPVRKVIGVDSVAPK